MGHGNEQTEPNSTEEINVEMRRSFSWDRAFFTSDGFLDVEELSSMIEGSGDDVKDELQKIEEIESLEAKLFQEIESSTQASTETSNVASSSNNLSSGKKDSQAKKVTDASSSSTPVKTVQPTKSSPSSGSSGGKKVKSPARKTSFKTGKATAHSPSKALVGITRNKGTPPASPVSSGSSSSSTFSVNQQSKRSSSVPRRSSLNTEKPSAINARRNDEWKTTKNKVMPASSRMSRTPPVSPGSSSSPTFSVNQRSKRSSSVPRRSSLNNEKPSAVNARRNDDWKAKKNKVVAASSRMSRTPPASPGSSGSSSSTFSSNHWSKSSSVPRRSPVNTEKPSSTNAKRNATMNNTGMSRTTPSSPVSSGLSSSTFSANHRSKRSSSVPRRSSVNNEKPSAINAGRNDEWKDSKPAVVLIPKTQSSISLKIKPPPVVSHPTSPSELFNSSSSSRGQLSESSTCKVNQRSKQVGRSKSSLKNHSTSQTPDRNRKQPAASHTETRSANTSKTRKLLAPKTAAAVDSGLKPISQKTSNTKPSKKQASAKAKSTNSGSRGAENIILASPEVLDIKGKLNALKMEISMQKKDRCKETKMSHDESGKGESSSFIQMNNQTKSK